MKARSLFHAQSQHQFDLILSAVQLIRLFAQYIRPECPERGLNPLLHLRISSDTAASTCRTSCKTCHASRCQRSPFALIKTKDTLTEFSTQEQPTSRSKEICRKVAQRSWLQQRGDIRDCLCASKAT